MGRMSLEDAKMVLRNRGWKVMPINIPSRYDLYKGNKLVEVSLTGREIVRRAKELLDKEDNRVEREELDMEIAAEMRATWEKGTKVVNIITGEEFIV